LLLLSDIPDFFL
jgi:hypothetical protein